MTARLFRARDGSDEPVPYANASEGFKSALCHVIGVQRAQVFTRDSIRPGLGRKLPVTTGAFVPARTLTRFQPRKRPNDGGQWKAAIRCRSIDSNAQLQRLTSPAGRRTPETCLTAKMLANSCFGAVLSQH